MRTLVTIEQTKYCYKVRKTFDSWFMDVLVDDRTYYSFIAGNSPFNYTY